MTTATGLLLVHAAATCFMAGLIWVVQRVHYPLFARIGPAEFTRYEREHMDRIGPIVGPAMLVEMGCAIWLVAQRPPAVDAALPITGLIMLILIWLSTALIQGPTHLRLTRGHDEALIRTLVLSNWLRTGLWSLRSIIALAMIAQSMPGGAG